MLIHRVLGGVSPAALFDKAGDGAGGAAAGAAADAGAGGGQKDPAAGAGAAGAGDGAAAGGDAKGKTVLSGEGGAAEAGDGAGAGQQAPADWPAPWRTMMAGEDKDTLALLERLGSPVEVAKKLFNQDKIIRSGQHKQPVPFPEKGTDAEKANWRKERGIPDAPDGYKIELGDGMVIGEADKPVVAEWTKAMHAANASTAEVNRAVKAYYTIQDAEARQLEADDTAHRQETEEALQAEWGRDFRRNANLIDNFLGAWPDGLGKLLVGGRLADGRRIGADQRIMRALLSTVLEVNPSATLVPAGGDAGKTVDTELADIRKFRQDNPDKYDQDKKMQARELELLDAQAKMRARRAA